MTFRGVYKDGIIVPHEELHLSNGAEVDMNVVRDRRVAKSRAAKKTTGNKLAKKPITKKSATKKIWGAGIWSHRTDIKNTAECAARLRRQISRGR